MSAKRKKQRRGEAAGGSPQREREAAVPAQTSIVQRPPALARVLVDARARWYSLALIMLTAAVYAPVWRNDFVAWDDPRYVTENAVVAQGLTWRGIRWAFTTGELANWHPLTWLSHMLDVQLFGMHAGPQHLVSVGIHILNTLLLFGLLARLTAGEQEDHRRDGSGFALAAGAFVAAMFAVHPLHVESVAWISERKDVLSTLFLLLALNAYASYAQRRGRRSYAGALALFTLGLMAKAMLITLPLILLLLDLWPLRRVRIRSEAEPPGERQGVGVLLREKIPFFAVAALFGGIALMVQRHGGAVATLDAFPLSLRIENALVSYVAYIGKMLWPVKLAAFYPYPASYPAWEVAACALLLLAVSVVCVRQLAARPYLAVGWLWYLVTLAPVIGLVQIGGQARADRYTYIPMIGILVMAAWGVPELLRAAAPKVVSAAAVCTVLACAVAAHGQVRVWRNSVSLWEHTLQVTSENFTAHTNLGHALLRQGRVEEAVAQYREALRLRQNFADAHQGLGVALASEGELDEAITQYREALRFEPASAELHNYLGAALAGKNLFGEAIGQYSEALRLKPDFADARNNLGAAYAGEGKYDEALREFLAALRLKPTADLEYNVGTMYEQQGDIQQAVRYYQTALQLDPGHRAARSALNDLISSGKVSGSVVP